MDFIYVPSRSTGEELAQKGISQHKIRLLPRGVDTGRFHPSKRNGYFARSPRANSGLKLLYVGRVSREKNLHVLAHTFKLLVELMDNVTLVIVGDGPYLAEMRETMRGMPCIFTGYLEGDDLSAVYASCDLFVFPSTTDTFGNVVLEAQASGIPVIVTNEGGPRENIIPGETGLVVESGHELSMLEAMHALLTDPQRLRAMGSAARRYVESRSFESVFDKVWELYQSQ
jgi:glycosyltransferase involved in cell wall biosynthesis